MEMRIHEAPTKEPKKLQEHKLANKNIHDVILKTNKLPKFIRQIFPLFYTQKPPRYKHNAEFLHELRKQALIKLIHKGYPN